MDYQVFSTLVLRNPLLPYTGLLKILESEESLLDTLSDKEIQEAVFLASPALYRELIKLLNGEMPAESEDAKRLLASLTRYICRMSTRCTPFGLFAGCKTATIDKITSLKPAKAKKRRTRLDMLYLYNLYDMLTRDPVIKENMKYFPNSSLYLLNGNYRYMESMNINHSRKYQIVEAEQSSFLDTVIETATKGAELKQLSAKLTDDEITEEDALDYINDLIDSQILVGELSQSIVGEDFLERLIMFVRSSDPHSAYLPQLERIGELLTQIDRDKSNMELYQTLSAGIREIGVPYEEKFLYQVDMAESSEDLHIGEDVIRELKSSIECLNKITPAGKNNDLEKFKNDFYNRYEDREVPLMEALDPDIGLGYPSKSNTGDISPLVDGFYFPPNEGNQQAVLPDHHPFHTLLFRKTMACISKKDEEIIFTDEDVKRLSVNWQDLPASMYSMFQIFQEAPNNFRLKLNMLSGSCAANLLARFYDTNKEIAGLVNEIVKREQDTLKDVILAEIVHLPESRIGNVLARPHFRDYEVLYIASSDLPDDRKIRTSDLWLSVRNGRIILRSGKLNKEIIPRLTTAHNYHNNAMPVYRFLCDMQMQDGRRALYFDWGTLGKELTYRPRVKYNHTVLSPVTWHFRIEELQFIFKLNKENNWKQKINDWRKEYRIHRFVLMPDNDNELFIDWENELSIRSLLPIIKNRNSVTFTEFFFSGNLEEASSGKEDYTNECIVAFYKK